MKNKINILDELRVPDGRPINLHKDYDPGYTGDFLKKRGYGGEYSKGNPAACRTPGHVMGPEYLRAANYPAGHGCGG